MTSLKSLSRAAACALALTGGGLSIAPAFGAPADVEFLKTFIGEWKGRGVMTGANSETVVCKMALSEGNQDKLNYSGRCSLAGTVMSLNGTVAYIEANKRFEAAMTTNATFTGTAVGRRQGDSIVFDMKQKEKDDAGNDMQIAATMILKGEQIGVDFTVVFVATGDTIKARVPFSK